jgi:O-antigen/teichoic acid export membrane protein
MTEGLGRPHFNAVLTGIASVICIVLMVVLTGPYGTLGVAVARLTGFATISFAIFLAERWFFGSVQTAFWLGHLKQIVPAAAVAFLFEYGFSRWLPDGWLALVLSVSAGGTAYALVLWSLDFVTTDEKLLLRAILRRAN